MSSMYLDEDAVSQLLKDENPVIYAFYELDSPNHPGDVSFGTSIVYPGKVGSEYFFTKGHFHVILDTAEVYYCLNGQGYLLIENPEGESRAMPVMAGQAAYVPKRYAHRSINTGKVPFVTFFAFRSDAGHDYASLESMGFKKRMIEKNGIPTVIDTQSRGVV